MLSAPLCTKSWANGFDFTANGFLKPLIQGIAPIPAPRLTLLDSAPLGCCALLGHPKRHASRLSAARSSHPHGHGIAQTRGMQRTE